MAYFHNSTIAGPLGQFPVPVSTTTFSPALASAPGVGSRPVGCDGSDLVPDPRQRISYRSNHWGSAGEVGVQREPRILKSKGRGILGGA